MGFGKSLDWWEYQGQMKKEAPKHKEGENIMHELKTSAIEEDKT